MSLFVLSYEYQRSIDRIWEDFSAHSRAQTEPGSEEEESKSTHSALDQDNRREALAESNPQNAITTQAMGGSELMQYDAKSWGYFLDSKRKK